MLIRYGYEITINSPQPTPLVCLLSVSEDRKADIRAAEKVFTTPIISTTTYLDTFGNRCRRLVAPAGKCWLQRNEGARCLSRISANRKRLLPGSKALAIRRTKLPPRRQGERELMAEIVLF